MKEIEILVELYTEIETAKKTLNQFKFIGSIQTLDVYYYDPLRDKLKLNSSNKLLECCRIRTKNNKHYVAYKVDIYDGEVWRYSEEYETEVFDLEAQRNIFKHLGLEELVTIDNLKHTYRTEEFEIVLEEVKNLGKFLEVEYCMTEHSKSVDEIRDKIYLFIKSLQLSIGEELNSGKPELLLLKK